MSSVTVYHYTDFSSIGAILGKHREPGVKAGLEPRRVIGKSHKGVASQTRAIFGLLEPEPESWMHNQEFPVTWPTLIHDLGVMASGIILLELKLDSEKNKVFVADRGHIEGALYDDQEGIPVQYHHHSLAEGEEVFMATMTPITRYMRDEHQLQYALPEVIILDEVSVDHLRVAEKQPLLEYELLNRDPETRNVIIGMIERGYASKELQSWRKGWEAEHGKLQQEDLSYQRARRK